MHACVRNIFVAVNYPVIVNLSMGKEVDNILMLRKPGLSQAGLSQSYIW
jgi:hypothetical protein